MVYKEQVREIGEHCITKKFMTCSFRQIFGDIFQKNEMGEACGTYGRQKKRIQGFGVET